MNRVSWQPRLVPPHPIQVPLQLVPTVTQEDKTTEQFNWGCMGWA